MILESSEQHTLVSGKKIIIEVLSRCRELYDYLVEGYWIDGKCIIVVYAVPNQPAIEERLRKEIQKVLTDQTVEILIIPITHIPYTADGEIDINKLRQLPLLSESYLKQIARRIENYDGVEQAVVVLTDITLSREYLHLSDLLPAEFIGDKLRKFNSDDEKHKSLCSTATTLLANNERMAICHGTDLVIPENSPKTLTAALLETVCKQPTKGILFIGKNENEIFQSYPELLSSAKRILSGLRKRGCEVGSTAIIHISQPHLYFTAFWGCVLGGIIPVTVSMGTDYSQKNAITEKLFNVYELLKRPIIITDELLFPEVSKIEKLYSLRELHLYTLQELSMEMAAEEIYMPDPDDIIFFQLTSGSTGIPKCIQIKHRGVVAHIHGVRQYLNYSPNDISLNWLPYDHVVPILTSHLKNTYLGCQQVEVQTALVVTHPLLWLELIHRHRITHTWAPNFGYKLVVDALKKKSTHKWDLSSIKYFMNAGEQVTFQVVKDFINSLEDCKVKAKMMQPAFGMAESCTCITYQRDFNLQSEIHRVSKESLATQLRKQVDEIGASIFVNLGGIIPGISMRIVDDHNVLVPQGVIGRLQIKGDVITPGYISNLAANTEAFVGDGWFNSGDLGFIVDEKLVLTGRQKETIIINGVNYFCYEIEEIISEISGVLPTYVAAISVADDSVGTERLVIFFVADTVDKITLKDLCVSINQKIVMTLGLNASIIIPVQRDDFFKTTSGKIQRAQFKKQLERGDYANQIKRMDILMGNENTLPDWFYRTVWVRRNLSATVAKTNDKVLVLDDDSQMAKDIIAELVTLNIDYYTVRRDQMFSFDKTNHIITLSTTSAYNPYSRLFKHLKINDIPINTILYCSNDKQENPLNTTCRDKICSDLISATSSFFEFINALVHYNSEQNPIQLMLLVNGAQPVFAEDEFAWQQTSIRGALKSISNEFNWLQVRCIDISQSNIAKLPILSELAEPVHLDEIAYRNNIRWVKCLERLNLARDKAQNIPIQKNGMYLISGGLGEIGFELAKFLLIQYKAKLLILGNTEISTSNNLTPSERQNSRHFQKLLELRQYGLVNYIAVDLGDGIIIDEFVTEAEREWKVQLSGIFHLAGVYREKYITEETRENIYTVLYPKVMGALTLHSILIKRQPKGLFVNFSSVLGTFPGAGLSVYAAANTFLDAFSIHQSKQGLTSFSLAWSQWESSIHTADLHVTDIRVAKGFDLVTKTRGIQSLLAVLQTSHPTVLIGLDATRPNIYHRVINNEAQLLFLVMIGILPLESSSTGDIQQCLKGLIIEDLRQRSFDYHYKLIDRALVHNNIIDLDNLKFGNRPSAAELRPKNIIEKQIKDIWQSIIGTADLSIQRGFFEQGGTSLLMLKLHISLNEKFNCNLTPLELFKYPTIAKQAEYIESLNKVILPTLSNGSSQPKIQSFDDKDIAVIGMSCTFPGAKDVEMFWENLKNSVESIRFFTDTELLKQGIAPETIASKNYVKASPIINDPTQFDAEFFNYSAREAIQLDPQQRLFLECAWHALENAGYDPNHTGHTVGIFAGALMSTYLLDNLKREKIELNLDMARFLETFLANDKDFLATRVAYKLDLQGPAITIQTACSTSLVAIHEACKSLLLNECDMCLAGAVAIRFPHEEGYMFEEGSIVSLDGHCRPFDAAAGGAIFGSGVGIVVLKRLSLALSNHDNVLAVIKATAVNNDGANKMSYTAPSVDGQSSVVQKTLAQAQLAPELIGFIEAHGTGTKLGDPVEVAALEKNYATENRKLGSCFLGSVKSNIGHLDTAAGMAGFIKTVLCLQHRLIPATLNYHSPNPAINLKESIFMVNNQCVNWDSKNQQKRYAAVNSLGAGGTNAHAILEEFISPQQSESSSRFYLIVLSAKTQQGLNCQVLSLLDFLKNKLDVSLANLSYTYQVGRGQFKYRKALICQTVVEAIDILNKQDDLHFCIDQSNESNEQWLNDLDLSNNPNRATLELLAQLWLSGKNIDWQKYYLNQKPYRIPLPLYPFDKRPYLFQKKIQDVNSSLKLTSMNELEGSNVKAVSSSTNFVDVYSGTAITERYSLLEKLIERQLKDVLEMNQEESISKEAGFFELGMDSLVAVDFFARLKEHFGKKFSIRLTIVFDYPTIKKLTDYLHKFFESSTEKVPLLTQSHQYEPIAVIGMDCRFPGGATNVNQFQNNLLAGKQGIREAENMRWDSLQYPHRAGFLDDIDLFDASFFNISPQEARHMDPQQRLLLETSWHALERSGLAPHSLRDTETGVFIGVSQSEYVKLLVENSSDDSIYGVTGNLLSVSAGRLAYVFGFQGPAMAIDTACSSSLVAVHEACRSLQLRECDVALAGGVNILLDPKLFSTLLDAHMLSPDGYCKSFDQDADGYVRSEGCGIVVLKRLSDAQRSNDNILAIIKGSAVNQDGSSSGLTVPNGLAQEKVMAKALAHAQLEPWTISYFEAHGTGTKLGDPIEMSAIQNIYGVKRTDPLIISTVKTQIGHAESAAGIAGLIKTILSMQAETIPKHMNFATLNPSIDLAAIPAVIPVEPTSWKKCKGVPRRAAISSFGLSGTNAHVILEEAPEIDLKPVLPKPYYLIAVSAKLPQTLRLLQENLWAYLKRNPSTSLQAMAHTLNLGRNHFNHRCAFVVSSVDELKFALQQNLQNQVFHLSFQGVANHEPLDKMIIEPLMHRIKKLRDIAYIQIDDYREQLKTLGGLYVKGYSVDWHLLHDGELRQVIDIPTYPFVRKRHWVKTKDTVVT